MILKISSLVFCLTFSSVQSGELPSENIYLNANIAEHFPEFLAMEITQDFKASITEYNQNRKDQNYFQAKIKDLKLAATFLKITKDVALPEIKQQSETGNYIIEAGINRVEFNTALFISNKFFLNGVEKNIKKEDFLISLENSSNKKNMINTALSHLISEAMADEDDMDLVSSYKNLDTTKILMASIIALDSVFKERSLLDKIPFSGDIANANLNNLVKKIEIYQTQCEENLESQATMQRVPFANFRNLDSMDQYSMIKRLSHVTDPTYQATLVLIKKMGAENNNYAAQRNAKLVANFNVDDKARQCEAMLKPLVKESKSKTNAIAAYIDGGNSSNVAYQNHPCTKIAKLKLCLTRFAAQASDINDFVRRKGSEARDAGAIPYDHPQNYPAENISR